MRDELHALQPLWRRGESLERSMVSGLFRRRKPQLDPQSRLIIRHFDLRSMEIGNGCNEAQTETTARAVTAPLAGRNLPR